MINFGSLVLAVVLLALTNAQPQPQPPVISEWNKLANGFQRAWQASNGPNNFQSTFAAGKIYVFGQRRVQSRNDRPGGIVSTLDVRSRQWSPPQEYTLNINNLRSVVFTLKSRPFMLTYDVQRDDSIRFVNLYYWNDGRGARWVSVPLDIDRQVSAANARTPIYVSVPDQDGSLAYINVLTPTVVRGPGGPQTVLSPIIFSLNLDLDRGNGNSINRASMRVAARIPGGGNTRGVVFTAVKDQSTFVAFARGDYQPPRPASGTYWQVIDKYEINRRNGAQQRQKVGNSVIFAPYARNDRIFQVKNYVVFFGLELTGRGGNVDHAWSYDFGRGDYEDRNFNGFKNQAVVDQKNEMIYDIDWDQVNVARLTF